MLVFDDFFVILLIVTSVLLVLLISMVCYRKTKKKIVVAPSPAPSAYVVTSQDIRAIAGDDMLTTQLDLARAYIEINKIALAKKILQHVIENGHEQQRVAAKQLLNNL